ncbi:MAG: CoA-binding protein [Paludibacter sp.]
MQLISLQNIDRFINCKVIAVAGASRKEKSFSASVIAHLRFKGYTVISINPNFVENNAAQNEFKSVNYLPKKATNLLVLTNPAQTLSVVKSAIERGIKNIWIQQKSETPEVIALCKNNNVNLIYNQCIFMFTQPEGMHKFHYKLKKFFGGIPK